MRCGRLPGMTRRCWPFRCLWCTAGAAAGVRRHSRLPMRSRGGSSVVALMVCEPGGHARLASRAGLPGPGRCKLQQGGRRRRCARSPVLRHGPWRAFSPALAGVGVRAAAAKPAPARKHRDHRHRDAEVRPLTHVSAQTRRPGTIYRPPPRQRRAEHPVPRGPDGNYAGIALRAERRRCACWRIPELITLREMAHRPGGSLPITSD